ncbi:hypothetical protein HKX48_001313 [Thoreauomyces humboldtii]|nr:hypothetical protein HKX48_001313 [Thoreauomyces humboldtii]
MAAPVSSSRPGHAAEAIRHQIEFYFSDENFPKDKHLQELTTRHKGWVPFFILLKFKRLVALGADKAGLRAALRTSSTLVMDQREGAVKRRFPVGERTEDASSSWTEVKVVDVKDGRGGGGGGSGKRSRSLDGEDVVRDAKTTKKPRLEGGSDVDFPSATDAMRAFQERHFGPGARLRFPHPPAATSTQRTTEYWSSLCPPCHRYWTERYAGTQATTADGEEEEEEEDADPEALVWSAAGGWSTRDEDLADDDADGIEMDVPSDEPVDDTTETPTFQLTPEMIAMFEHSERWKLQKAKLLAEEEQKEMDDLVAVEKEAAQPSAVDKEAMYGSESAYTIALLEDEVEQRFRRHVETSKPVLWPILPIRP